MSNEIAKSIDEMKLRCFRWEIDQMNQPYREVVKRFLLDVVQKDFWCAPASSSGKYHPACANAVGGLIVHTKRVVYLLHQFMQANRKDIQDGKALDEIGSQMILAGILHDMAKKSKYDSYAEYEAHPFTAADIVMDREDLFLGVNNPKMAKMVVSTLIRKHMGPFTPGYSEKDLNNYTKEEYMLYYADFLASRKSLGTFVDDFTPPEELLKYAQNGNGNGKK
jgi:hypothetical protein